ncbi:MAG: serine/threonine-protein phosphatase [Clostridia bacterium]|nr:serine/threonine-protein phosphatase [Clostridia bacterium]
MQYFANSDRGLVRPRNQDRYLTLPLPGGALLAAVFDGMGGHADGDLAAETARDAFSTVFSAVTAPLTPEAGADLLTAATREADRAILALTAAGDGGVGMGTTVTSLLLLPTVALTLNVGDSRIYRYRLGELCRLTRDDSYVQELIDRGLLLPEEAPLHPRRNVITRALGSLGEAPLTVGRLDVLRGDTYLLCSDGLYGMTGEPFLSRILSQQLGTAATVGYLIAAANEKGGTDNITAALVRV